MATYQFMEIGEKQDKEMESHEEVISRLTEEMEILVLRTEVMSLKNEMRKQ